MMNRVSKGSTQSFYGRWSPREVALVFLAIGCLNPTWLWAHGRASEAEVTPRTIVFPDIEGGKTLVADLHMHSVFSDGHVWPKTRVEEALRDGLDAIAITEHLEWQPHLIDLPHTDRNRAHAIAAAAAEGRDLMVIQG